MSDFARTSDFRRSAEQESLLQCVNDWLAEVEQRIVDDVAKPTLPLIFIVGAPRSGTTLMLQWLAASGTFGYPTNFLSRFFRAPYIGIRIQQLLTDPSLDYRGELFELTGTLVEWVSEAGKTRGALQPHEFFYFWRRFFPIDQAAKLTREQLEASDPEGFVRGWGLIERALRKPLAAKGILLQYDIDLLAEWLPRAVFVYTRRDPFFNAQSLLEARERVFGTWAAWFSVKPPEYDWLRHEDPYTQVAGQVLFTNRAIEAALDRLPSNRCVRVDYEDFCRSPSHVWTRLDEALTELGFPLGQYNGPEAFTCTNEVRSPEEDVALVRRAYRDVARR